ncbi:MAG: hypothetical protein ACOYL6_05610 [Bacteriovoracaceae bacterium]
MKISREILKIITNIPSSDEKKSDLPEERVEILIQGASWKAAVVSCSLAIPPGPLGLITILPDLVLIWRIQSQLVSDIAAVYGHSHNLSKEEMMYCLFKHGGAALFRDVVLRMGERYVVKRTSFKFLEMLAEKVGVRLTQRVIGSGVARLLPIIGSLGIGWYAKFDTKSVGETAHELFRVGVKSDDSSLKG